MPKQMKQETDDQTARVAPAFIDPPDPYFSTVDEWRTYRDDLRRSGIPNIEPFVREADRVIARLSRARTDDEGQARD